MDSTSLTTASVAEISRLRADKALGEFIGGPEEAQLLEVSGQALNRHGGSGEPPLPTGRHQAHRALSALAPAVPGQQRFPSDSPTEPCR